MIARSSIFLLTIVQGGIVPHTNLIWDTKHGASDGTTKGATRFHSQCGPLSIFFIWGEGCMQAIILKLEVEARRICFTGWNGKNHNEIIFTKDKNELKTIVIFLINYFYSFKSFIC